MGTANTDLFCRAFAKTVKLLLVTGRKMMFRNVLASGHALPLHGTICREQNLPALAITCAKLPLQKATKLKPRLNSDYQLTPGLLATLLRLSMGLAKQILIN